MNLNLEMFDDMVKINLTDKILEDITTINMNDIEKIPNKKGIYYFYNNKKELIYLGKTKNLNRRVKQHLTSSSFKDSIYEISFFIVENNIQLDIYETYLINELKPIYNIGKTFYKIDEKEETEKKEKELAILKKKENFRKQQEEHREQQLEIDTIREKIEMNIEKNEIHYLLKFAIKNFLDEREFRQVSKNTLTNYRNLFKDFYNYCLEHETIEIGEITQIVIKSYLQYCLKEKGNSPVSINTRLTAIKTLFNYLEEIELITSRQNPAKKIKYLKTEVKITTFTDTQIKEMFNYYSKIKKKEKFYFAFRDSMIIMFLLSTGVRLGEMCGIKWSDIDFVNKYIIIFGKLRVQQSIPIIESLKKELQEYKIYCKHEFKVLPEYVFVNRKGERLTENAVQNILKRLRDAMQFPNVRCCAHDFRRYYAKTLILQGADAFTVQRLLRHSKIDMTLKYVALYDHEIEQRNEKWNPMHKFDKYYLQ